MVDIAGDGPVHLVGGATGLVAAWMLGPRFGRYNKSRVPTPMASPTNALLGTFMLWSVYEYIAMKSRDVFKYTLYIRVNVYSNINSNITAA